MQSNRLSPFERTFFTVPELLRYGVDETLSSSPGAAAVGGGGGDPQRRDLCDFDYAAQYCVHIVDNMEKLDQDMIERSAQQQQLNASLRVALFSALDAEQCATRIPRLPKPIPPPSQTGTATTLCSDARQCHFAHTALEYFYHPQNYKQQLCRCAVHHRMYPSHARPDALRELPDAPAVQLDTLRRCPFYHTVAERHAWDLFRTQFADYRPSLSTPQDIRRCMQGLLGTAWFRELGILLDRYRQYLHREMARHAAEVLAGNRACMIQPLTASLIAHEMKEGDLHRVVCLLAFAEWAGIPLEWPSMETKEMETPTTREEANRRSALVAEPQVSMVWLLSDAEAGPLGASYEALLQRQALIVCDPTRSNVELWLDEPHRRAVGQWLTNVATAIQMEGAGAEAGGTRLIRGAFLVTKNPYEHGSRAHLYRTYLAAVVTALRRGWEGSQCTVAPLPFLAGLSDAAEWSIAHWLCSEVCWIVRGRIDTTQIEQTFPMQ